MIKMNKKGFTLVEIMIGVAIIGLLAAIAIPSMLKARETSQKNACIANLKQIEGAIERYAMESQLTSGGSATMTQLVNGGYLKSDPSCPAGGTGYASDTTF